MTTSLQENSFFQKLLQQFLFLSLLMVVNKIVVHQNEDKTLDIKFEMNGKLGDNKEIEIPD